MRGCVDGRARARPCRHSNGSGQCPFLAINEKGFLISDDVSDNNAFTDFVIKKNAKYYVYKFESKYIGIAEK